MPVPIELEAGWAPQPIWMISTKQKSLAVNGIRIPYSPFRSLVTRGVTRGEESGTASTGSKVEGAGNGEEKINILREKMCSAFRNF
jgi:hypothetical protein